MKKRIAIIGTVGIPPRYGGFETFVNQLIIHLKYEYDFLVFCSKKKYEDRRRDFNGIKRIFLPFNANGYQSVLYDVSATIFSIFKADIFLILGISGGVFLPIVKIFTKKKIIVSVDGLDPKREKWSWIAKKFLEISEWCAVKYADEIISDAKGIHKYIYEKYGIISVLIEYGSDHSKSIIAKKTDIEKHSFLTKKYAVAIARIEKENHSEIILKAFKNLSELQLVFVGTWQNNKYSRELYDKYKSQQNITLLDPIYDESVINLIRSNAAIFIHGNGAGGTNPGLLEAMHIGLPIIAYDVEFNRKVTQNNALFFYSEEQLIKNINKYLVNQAVANRDGKAVEGIAKSKYTWGQIVSKYKVLFDS